MSRGFNFTNRADISNEVMLKEVDRNPLVVDVEFHLERIASVKPIHEVVITAKHRTRVERKSLGLVGNLSAAKELIFNRFIDAKGVDFDVIVFEEESRKIIARGESLDARLKDAGARHQGSGGKKSIVFAAVVPSDEIDGLFWKLDYSGKMPTILLNADKFDFEDEIKSELFRSLALVEAFREALTHAFIASALKGFPGWAHLWKKYTRDVLNIEGGPQQEPVSDEFIGYVDETNKWIDACCSAFGKKLELVNIKLPKGGER